MKELQFDTGLVTYKVNGGHEITFNPGDLRFVKRLYDTFDKLAERQDEAKKENTEGMDGKAFFVMTEKRDAEMRKDLDALFGEGASDAIFQDLSVEAIAGGFPLWANFLLAVIDEIDENLAQEEQKGHAKYEKYMKKYNAYKRK